LRDWTYEEQHNLIKMKNLKHIFTFAFYFLGLGAVFAQENKSLPLANEEYADKFVDAANYSFKFKIPK
jgi:hypothetical protein